MNEKDHQLKVLFNACLSCLDAEGTLKVAFTYNYNLTQQVKRCYDLGATSFEVDKAIQNALNAYHQKGKNDGDD